MMLHAETYHVSLRIMAALLEPYLEIVHQELLKMATSLRRLWITQN
jgi:hypothetical protein